MLFQVPAAPPPPPRDALEALHDVDLVAELRKRVCTLQSPRGRVLAPRMLLHRRRGETHIQHDELDKRVAFLAAGQCRCLLMASTTRQHGWERSSSGKSKKREPVGDNLKVLVIQAVDQEAHVRKTGADRDSSARLAADPSRRRHAMVGQGIVRGGASNQGG